ncbi:response regulator transcription factor [Actinosynnema sp. NPDC023794]
MTTPRVLVVDDEPNIRELLCAALGLHGFDVSAEADGGSALDSVARRRPDIVVLDVGLRDMNGFTVAKMLRVAHGGLPVLFLTARDAVDDRIAGFTAGGDDYVTKPFSLEEVVLRLRAILRRSLPDEVAEGGVLRYADLELNEDTFAVRREGREIPVSMTEFRLLHYLMANAGQVLTRQQILDRVWACAVGEDSRVVDSYISYLRRKVDAQGPPLIHTLRGVGYSLRVPAGHR